MKRSEFLKTVVASSIAGFSMLNPEYIFANNSNSNKKKSIRVGFIGCGGRGTGVISAMSRNNDIHITALADIFQDQIDIATPKINALNSAKGYDDVKKKHIYVGHDAYLKLLKSDAVDAVLISTPAYAHPFIFEAAVAANKHVYCEKPAAQDVYGTQQMLEVAKNVNHLSLVFGFQIRYASTYVDFVDKLHEGAIGDIVSAQLLYNSSEVAVKRPDNISDDEFRIRNHFHYLAISGGNLGDQGIHMLDICNLVLKSKPLHAIGIGGNRGGTGVGDKLTNYQVVYKYPNDINVSIQSSQVGPIFGEVSARFIGTKGYAEITYGGAFIKGKTEWKSESNGALFDADANKGRSFISSITSGKYINQIENGCESTLTAFLGREAVLADKKVTWDELISSNQRFDHKLNLSKFK